LPWFWAPRPAPAAITQRDIAQVGITTPPNAMLLLDLPLQGQDGLATAPDDRVTRALAGLEVDPTTIRLAITEAGKGAATLETGKRLPPYPVNLERDFHLNDRPTTVPDNGHLRRTSNEPYDGIACHIGERSGRFLLNALHGRKLYSFVGGGDPIRSSKSK